MRLLRRVRLHHTADRIRIDPRSRLFEFWRQPSPDGNDPAGYVAPVGRSEALAAFITDIDKDARILEVGCNVGRNLAYLYDHGWTNVEGLEISPHAVKLLRETYPQLDKCQIHEGPAEELLPRFADQSFDLVFTMAVLEHIHPSSTSVFDDIARIGRSVVTIEPPGHSSHRQYPHDVPALMVARGKTLTTQVPFSSLPGGDDPAISWYLASRFD